MPNEDLLTVDEAAERARVHRRTVTRWIAAGRLTAHRINARGHQIWIDRAELDALTNRPTIAEIIADAPPLTPEQAEQLRALLRRGGAA